MTVLTLLLVLLLQIANHTLQASRLTSRQLDSTQTIRRALDVISGDLANAVTGDGAAVLFQAGPRLNFLTRARGPVGPEPSRFLAVSYRVADGRLLRSHAAVPWTDTDFLAATVADGADSVLAEGILQFAILAVLEDGSIQSLGQLPVSGVVDSGEAYMGHSVPAGWSAILPIVGTVDATQPRVRALSVAIAAVDEQNFALLSDAQRELFPQPTKPEEIQDPVGFWESLLRKAVLPMSARSAIRFNSKLIRLP